MKHKALPDPQQVLSDRVRPDLRTLVALIHQVNPTDKGLSKGEQESRYALKSALQALLVRRFPSSLRPRLDARDPDIVSLQLVEGGGDAGHARISGLDPELRAWVEERLDSEDDPRTVTTIGRVPGSPPLSPAPSSPEDPLELGLRAMEEWDYDLARSCFEESFHRSGGSLASAKALLPLLIETLCVYEQALALEPMLGAQARACPELRGLVALAAAHLGQEELALSRLRGCTDSSRRAEVLALLAERAAGRGEILSLEAHLLALRGCDPFHPGLPGLDDRLMELRRQARLPHEALIERLLSQGELEQAAEHAEELLRREAGSEVARRAIRALEERRQRDEMLGKMRRITELLDAGDARSAMELLSSLSGSSKGSAELRELSNRAREMLRSSEIRERRARFGLLLQEGRRAEALLLAAEGEQDPSWDRLDPLLPMLQQLMSQRPPPQARHAVQALLHWESLSASEQDPIALLAGVEAHRGLLRRVPELRRRFDELQAQRTNLRAQGRAAVLLRARDCIAPDQAEELLENLEHFDPAEACDEELREVERLGRTARAWIEQKSNETEWSALIQAGRLFEARRLALRLSAQEPRWAERALQLRKTIDDEYRFATLPGSLAWKDLRDHLAGRANFMPRIWMRPDGEELWVPDHWERWIVLRRLHIESGEILDLKVLRSPVPLTDMQVMEWDDRLWVYANEGLLILSLSSDEVLDWIELTSLLPPSEQPQGCFPSIGDHCLWILSCDPEAKTRAIKYDLESRKSKGWQPNVSTAMPLPGARPGTVVLVEPEDTKRVLDGGSFSRWTSYVQLKSTDACHGLEPSSFCFLGEAANGSGLPPSTAELVVLSPWRQERRIMQVTIEGARVSPNNEVACSTQDKAIFSLCATRSHNSLFVAGSGIGGFQQLYFTPVPHHAFLVQHPLGRWAALSVVSVRGCRFQKLGPSKPHFFPIEMLPRLFTLAWAGHATSSPDHIELGLQAKIAQAMAEGLERRSDEDAQTWVERAAQQFSSSSVYMAALLLHVHSSKDLLAPSAIIEWIEADPARLTDPILAWVRGVWLHSVKRNEEALAQLECVPREALSPPLRDELSIYLGICHAFLGHNTQARDAWRSVERKGAYLTDMIGIIEARLAPVDGPAPAIEEQQGAANLTWAVRRADYLQSQSRYAEALAMLYETRVYVLGNLAVLGRIARLIVDHDEPSEAIHRLVSLSAFLERGQREHEYEKEPGMEEHALPESEVSALEERARRWLEDFDPRAIRSVLG